MAAKRTKPTFYEPPVDSLQLLVRVEFRADIRRLLVNLGALDREIAELLGEYGTSDTALLLGISRARVYRGIGRIRTAFRAGGYLR
jgi:hypothetical protein